MFQLQDLSMDDMAMPLDGEDNLVIDVDLKKPCQRGDGLRALKAPDPTYGWGRHPRR